MTMSLWFFRSLILIKSPEQPTIAESLNALMKSYTKTAKPTNGHMWTSILCLDEEYCTHITRGYKGIGDYRLLEKEKHSSYSASTFSEFLGIYPKIENDPR